MQTEDRYHLLDDGELSPGTCRHFEIAGRQVALFRFADGSYHALDGECVHRGGPLGEGDFDGHRIRCPWHGWVFDARTGELVRRATVRQDVLGVEVEDGAVFVRLA